MVSMGFSRPERPREEGFWAAMEEGKEEVWKGVKDGTADTEPERVTNDSE
jgi:hypothetical protein